jgi:hypothetical protein
MVPFPDPDVPEVIVAQLAPKEADHVHPAGVVSATDPVPASFVKDADVGDSPIVQAARASTTVSVAPPMVSVAERLTPLGFGATV